MQTLLNVLIVVIIAIIAKGCAIQAPRQSASEIQTAEVVQNWHKNLHSFFNVSFRNNPRFLDYLQAETSRNYDIMKKSIQGKNAEKTKILSDIHNNRVKLSHFGRFSTVAVVAVSSRRMKFQKEIGETQDYAILAQIFGILDEIGRKYDKRILVKDLDYDDIENFSKFDDYIRKTCRSHFSMSQIHYDNLPKLYIFNAPTKRCWTIATTGYDATKFDILDGIRTLDRIMSKKTSPCALDIAELQREIKKSSIYEWPFAEHAVNAIIFFMKQFKEESLCFKLNEL
ncbi:MAG: hypothetical protein P1U37_12195 [Minwuia sp.]|nr:hypothetical protein [Minwuia sp.]